MEPTWSKWINYHFVEEGVWVTVPPQESGHELALQPKEIPPIAEMPEDPTQFTPEEIVINFEVLEREKEGGSISVVHEFSPRMTLRVKRRGKLTKLAYHDGRIWVVFTDQDHKFSLTDKSGIAFIRDWGDPPVAWG